MSKFGNGENWFGVCFQCSSTCWVVHVPNPISLSLLIDRHVLVMSIISLKNECVILVQFSNMGENLVCPPWFESLWLYCCHFVNFYKGGGVDLFSFFHKLQSFVVNLLSRVSTKPVFSLYVLPILLEFWSAIYDSFPTFFFWSF